MNSWIITLSNGTRVNSTDVTVGQQALVSVLVGKSAHADLDPTQSFDALCTWLAVLEATATQSDVVPHLEAVMALTVSELYSRISTE